jgi:hypothetical protein
VTHLPDCPLPRPSASFVASWKCSTFTDDFCRKLLLLRHHYTTFSPAPESKALIPLPERRNSTRPSKSARKACHVPRYWCTLNPRHLHSSQTPPLLPWVPYYNVLTTLGSLSHSSPRSSTLHSRNQCIRSRTPSYLRGREVFPPNAGSAPLHHLHGPQTNHLRLPAETIQMITAAIQLPGLKSTVQDRHTTHITTGQRCR